MGQMSKIIIGILLVGLLATVIVTFMSGMEEEYGGDVDNSSIVVYQRLDEINNLTEELEDNAVANAGAKSDFTDIIGGFLLDGYRSLVISFKSVATLKTISEVSVENVNLGGAGFANSLKTTLIAIAIVFIVLAIIVSTLVRRDL